MKPMKIIAVFILLSVLSLGRLLAQSEVKETMTVPLSEPGKPFKVIAHVMYSSLKVVGYEGKEIVINVTGSERKRESSDGGGLRRIGGNAGGDVTAEEDNNTVNIGTGLSHFSLIEIKVPQSGGKLDLGAVNGGSIVVDNISGQFEISNVNGSITATNVSGSVVANSVNGNVVIGFNSVDAQAPMAFSTLNGKIDITFPASIKANVKLKAERGDIFTDFDVDITKGQPAATKSNEGHMYRVTIDDWVHGKINGGGQEMMMKTSFGSIYIRKAK
jgi:hypothetical protein